MRNHNIHELGNIGKKIERRNISSLIEFNENCLRTMTSAITILLRIRVIIMNDVEYSDIVCTVFTFQFHRFSKELHQSHIV